MRKANLFLTLLVFIACFALETPVPSASVSAAGETPKVIQTQDTNIPGVMAELTECKRKEGVLSLKVRFHNTGGKEARLNFYSAFQRKEHMEKFYVTAADKKYFVLKDSEGQPLMSDELNTSIQKDESYTWWGKFPAPPVDVKKINLVVPQVLPFDDVPVADQ